ncbi:DUF4136 domain-containing protein [Hephaestia sp. GCM10023244]|uniref:DUF4136 domain-containing protein n=1 Tax=unclassified Hephaestia TaxID=2631281 RepID=UPI002077612C|nr:DUF4136 domain-containing protein [Hephaestia sp. MAHUQ-44]MCM8732200.1 DUF4136 domain-containing protein [Hephaestia sp. MAHUQ-44]
MRTSVTIMALALAGILAGCASGPAPVDVTRFHLGRADAPLDRGTIIVEPFAPAGPASLEYKTYAAAVQTELMRSGYTVPPPGDEAAYVATVNFMRASRGTIERRSPFSIGLGGASFGRNVGVGAGLSVPIGKRRTRELIVSELSVQIKRRADSTVVWEGRAQSQAVSDAPDATASAAAARMARALFKDFPGLSGVTIEVK